MYLIDEISPIFEMYGLRWVEYSIWKNFQANLKTCPKKVSGLTFKSTYIIFSNKKNDLVCDILPAKRIKLDSDNEMDIIPLEYENSIKEEPTVKIETPDDTNNVLKILVENDVYDDTFDTTSEIEMAPLEENGLVKCEAPEFPMGPQTSLVQEHTEKGTFELLQNSSDISLDILPLESEREFKNNIFFGIKYAIHIF